jgi:hypothetical protein
MNATEVVVSEVQTQCLRHYRKLRNSGFLCMGTSLCAGGFQCAKATCLSLWFVLLRHEIRDVHCTLTSVTPSHRGDRNKEPAFHHAISFAGSEGSVLI